MKIFASYIIHYGAEWLYWSVRSVLQTGLVDQVYIHYTPTPSHGHATNMPCPETHDQIFDSLRNLQGNVTWIDYLNPFRHEGEHRTAAVNRCFADGADLVMVVDADELWDEDSLRRCIVFIQDNHARTYRVGALLEELSASGVMVMAKGKKTLLEEAPGAYKDIHEVVRVVERAGIGRKVARIKPLCVIKG